MLILIQNTGELEGFDVLSVLGRSNLLGSLVLDVDGGLDSSLDGLDSGRSHDCCGCWVSVDVDVDGWKGVNVG